MSVATRIRAALRGGRRMTVAQLVEATGCSKNGVTSALRGATMLVCVGMVRADGGANGGGRNSKVWALKGAAPEYAPPPVLLGPDGPVRSDIPDTEGIADDSEEGCSLPTQAGPSQWVLFEPSAETVECPTSGTVRLADCIDGYVDATACERGTPCDSCSIGRQRRAAWAGADFEDELESDGDEAYS